MGQIVPHNGGKWRNSWQGTPTTVRMVADYYQSRYRELRAEGLFNAAVASFFQARADATAAEQEVEAALAVAGVEDAADRFATLANLNRLGYVWCPPGQVPPVTWSAGIPSLMTYILEHGPTPH